MIHILMTEFDMRLFRQFLRQSKQMSDAQRSYLLAKYGSASSSASAGKPTTPGQQPVTKTGTLSIVDEDGVVNAGVWGTDQIDVQTKPSKSRRLFKSTTPYTHPTITAMPSVNQSPPRRHRPPASPPSLDAVFHSPPRRQDGESPPRRPPNEPESPPRRQQNASPPRRPEMASGAGAGLQTAASVRSAIESKQASERQRLAQLDKSVSGRGAETIHRDKYGRIVDPAVEQHRLQELEREKERRRQQQIDNLKGQQQLREYREQQQTLQAMESAPFARHADDADINRRLRQQMHWNDPMRRKDDEFSAVQIPLSAAESAAAQTALKRKRLYRGGAPPNRFSIQPGYRWDGVDRSNGFEANWFRKQAERAANAAEAYKWSTEDM